MEADGMVEAACRDDIWYELLDGRPVAMSPRPVVNHNIAVTNVTSIFQRFLRGKPCTVFTDGVDVFLTPKDRVIPDVTVVCDKSTVKPDGVHGAPDLAVEVLSPSTAKRDRGYKKNLYERCGIREYWIIDTDSRLIEVYLLTDGRYELDEVYAQYSEYLLNKMTEEEINEIKKHFSPSIFPKLTIAVADVFEGLF